MSARSRLECPPHYTAGRTAAQDDVSFLKFQSNNTVIAVIFHRVLRSVGGRVSNLPLNDLSWVYGFLANQERQSAVSARKCEENKGTPQNCFKMAE